jgi:nicotinate-nucleotide adenylyltransferase
MPAPVHRTGVLGGTFDPPHLGHLLAAVNVRHALELDEVLLVVANDPWQKSGERSVTPAEDRLAMVEAAARGLEGVEASDLEILRGGPSYTVDTLEELRARDPDGRRFLILGSDAAAGLLAWDRAEDLPSLATLVLVDRPGIPCPPPPPGWELRRVEIPRIEVSSTDLRARVTDGRPLDLLVPDAVRTVIEQRRLYRQGRP